MLLKLFQGFAFMSKFNINNTFLNRKTYFNYIDNGYWYSNTMTNFYDKIFLIQS